jgi:hypothetical protein
MTTDPNVTYMLFQLEHDLRVAQAQRGFLADQAAALRGRHPVARAVGRWTGNALVAAGERLQGLPRATGATDSAPALEPGGQA